MALLLNDFYSEDYRYGISYTNFSIAELLSSLI